MSCCWKRTITSAAQRQTSGESLEALQRYIAIMTRGCRGIRKPEHHLNMHRTRLMMTQIMAGNDLAFGDDSLPARKQKTFNGTR
jgi:hypothetical protein